jgi:hypothetical protein
LRTSGSNSTHICSTSASFRCRPKASPETGRLVAKRKSAAADSDSDDLELDDDEEEGATQPSAEDIVSTQPEAAEQATKEAGETEVPAAEGGAGDDDAEAEEDAEAPKKKKSRVMESDSDEEGDV